MREAINKALRLQELWYKEMEGRLAPHLYFSSYLDDLVPAERTAGMQMGLQILKRCDEIWVFGTPTEGMRGEIKLAKSLKIPIIHIPQHTINQILERGKTA